MAKYDIDKQCYKDYKLNCEYDSITSKKCKCGHIITFQFNENNICRYCGRINFINQKAEFNYRVKRRLGK